jgi:hypothetical protein
VKIAPEKIRQAILELIKNNVPPVKRGNKDYYLLPMPNGVMKEVPILFYISSPSFRISETEAYKMRLKSNQWRHIPLFDTYARDRLTKGLRVLNEYQLIGSFHESEKKILTLGGDDFEYTPPPTEE